MTPEETKKAIAVMQHYADGGKAEYTSQGDDNWLLVKNPGWDWDNYYYRIKRIIPEVGKWYEFPRGGKYKCIAFEFGYYYFSNLIDDEPDVVVYQDACDFSNFKEVQP